MNIFGASGGAASSISVQLSSVGTNDASSQQDISAVQEGLSMASCPDSSGEYGRNDVTTFLIGPPDKLKIQKSKIHHQNENIKEIEERFSEEKDIHARKKVHILKEMKTNCRDFENELYVKRAVEATAEV